MTELEIQYKTLPPTLVATTRLNVKSRADLRAALTDLAGRLPADLAAQLSRVRELSAPPEEGEDAPPPSLEVAEEFIASVAEAIDLGRQLAAQVGL